MKDDANHIDWPPAPADRGKVAAELAPPAELEERVVANLKQRGLLAADGSEAPAADRRPVRVRLSLASAACVVLLATGVVIGRQTAEAPRSLTALTGAEDDLYALLLYETSGYDAASAAEAASRYSEYSQWVGQAVRAGQFVTGEDLEVHRGWLLAPEADGTQVSEATAVAASAPLSGIFFIRAAAPEQALALAGALPHLKHGGQVLVQKTIPTDTPPP